MYFTVAPYFLALEEREGARPRDGITVVHSEHIDIGSMEFYFITTRDPNLIELRFNTSPNQNIVKPAILGIYFPYKVNLDKTYNTKNVDYSSWYEEEFDNGKIFIKQLSCQSQDNCDLSENDQVKFILDPEITFDSLNIYRHNVKIKFDNPGGKGYDVFGKFEDSRNLAYGFTNFTGASATIIIPENADNIHTLPAPEPGIFHNSANDYSNTQLDWSLTKNEHAFFVDYQMPDERQNFEFSQSMTAGVAILLGLVGISASFFYGVSRNITK